MIVKFSNVCPFKFHRNIFGCAYCPYTSPDFDPIRSHTEEHGDRAMAWRNLKPSSGCKVEVTELRCGICRKYITDISTLFEHLIETHDIPLNRHFGPGVLPYLLNDGFVCADCGFEFDLFRNLSSHMNIHYPHFICSDCGLAFTNELRLNAHMNVHQEIKRKFRCTNCFESFTTNQSRRNHMASKHNIFAHKCPYCDESFKDHRIRVLHLNKYHNKNINYPCSVCPKVFSTSSNRVKHVRRLHMKEKLFVCTTCGEMYNTKDELNNHVAKHSGEKNYQCQVCSKAYARKKTLIEHMRIHNDDRRFVCGYCDKAFVQKCSLKRHMKTHHTDDAADDGDHVSSDIATIASVTSLIQTKAVCQGNILEDSGIYIIVTE